MPEKMPFHMLVKPIGPTCNLACKYCYYLSKDRLYPAEADFRMDEETLELFIQQYIRCHPGPVVPFGWQGGEPTLLGLEFFRKVIELQQKHLPPGWRCENALQTNGILLDEDWCRFLKGNGFLVGISIDGPEEIHDLYRRDKRGNPTHRQVMCGLRLLQDHGVEYNVLCVVNRGNVERPLEVYRFFREEGVRFIQFIPLVERNESGRISSRSVSGREFGRFLTEIFDEWLANDLGTVFVQLFEECVAAWYGRGTSLCTLSEICGRSLVLEHNGDVYACDHFVVPEWKLGNILEVSLEELVASEKQRRFGRQKRDQLSAECRECEVYFICHGGCTKNRVVEVNRDGARNYLCAGYKQFFRYIDPFMRMIADCLKKGGAPRSIRRELKQAHDKLWKGVGRNDPCPCQSGRKFKKCCLGRHNSR